MAIEFSEPIESVVTIMTADGVEHRFDVTEQVAQSVLTLTKSAADLLDFASGNYVPVYLVSVPGHSIIRCIKYIRQLTGLSLKESKAIYDITKENRKSKIGTYPWNEAQQVVSDLRRMGVVVESPTPLELLAQASE